MEFKKYQHIEKLERTATDGILDGMVYVFPKIDGTNGSIWLNKKHGIKCGSRNRELSLCDDNAGFMNQAICDKSIIEFFKKYPNFRIYGEWLVPHSLKTYNEDAWRKFYVFDVVLNHEDHTEYIQYEVYKDMLDEFEIDYITPIYKVENPTEERILESIQQNNFLIKDGEGIGEGVVIKNYDFKNKFGRTIWAKVITNEFKVKHSKSMGVREVNETISIEEKIAANFISVHLIEKVHAKILTANGCYESKDIPRLLNTIYYDLINEDMWQILKENKSATINFNRLQKKVFECIKKLKPELF